jgi:signal transduction histidine kinase
LTLEDNGLGIEPEFIDKVFDLFERAGATGDVPGTGIGLALCKRVVENHGGTIGVESIRGEGSRFFFTLPERRANG